ncbi:hypothetical protein [Nocardia sp. XZ_19_385]|uniref:hypothetical protein n=1 Tax=Nocardia sp. XZ_19_385 TaxID=2769488 RepID=UPI002815ED7A|nr:hypothetical protein [Nocardia sp. XZ_19_385]
MKSARSMPAGRVALRGVAVAVTALALTSCGLVPEHRMEVAPQKVVLPTDGMWRSAWSAARSESLASEFALLKPAFGGRVGLAIMPVGGGKMTVLGDWTSGIAWSTIKVPLAIAALRHDPEGVLSDVEAAITWSDNGAADALWASLGAGAEAAKAVQEVLDEAGDDDTDIAASHTQLDLSAFGATEWTLTDQVKFAAKLPCLAESGTVTKLMGEITPEQAWGLGKLDDVEFKGGWGPDDDTGIYTVRQFGLVPTKSGRVAIAVAAQADSGTYEDATAMLDDLAELLDRHLGELRGGKCPR